VTTWKAGMVVVEKFQIELSARLFENFGRGRGW